MTRFQIFEVLRAHRIVHSACAAAVLLAIATDSTLATNECPPGWVTGYFPEAGGGGNVHALLQFNGDLFVGGWFTQAPGPIAASNIARWDGLQFHAFGEGLAGGTNRVYALAIYNGELYAAGFFTVNGGAPGDRIACWNGESWAPVGSGLSAAGLALTIYNGDLTPCPGDITGSGSVGVPDLLALLACWGPVTPGCESADLTNNGNVGVPDLLMLLANWGPCP